MKKAGILFAGLILANLIWMGFVRKPLPPLPEICAELSDEVRFNFSINTMDNNGLEFSLNEKIEGKGMYVQFRMANAWKTGRPGLVVSGIKGNSDFRNGMSPDNYLKDPGRQGQGGKDFSNFMKDNSGKKVANYSFRQTLVESTSGETFLRMSYDGPAMEMLQTLEIPRPITIPAHISRKFTASGIIQFQPGTVAFDPKVKGFNIPVVIR